VYRGFPATLVNTIRCPTDGGQVDSDTEDHVIERGSLVCRRCGRVLHVEDGVVNLLQVQAPIDTTASREVGARDREASSYDDRHSARWDLEIPSTLAGIPLAGRSVVDLGCGTGRITVHVIETARSVVAIDFSRRSLEVLAKKIPERAEVGLVLADVTAVPLAESAFDSVLSTQVVEHIPTRETRKRFFELVRRSMRPDGIFVCTAYHHDLRSRLGRLDREGVHESGIYYHRFTRKEIEREMAPHFHVVSVRPIKVAIPYLVRLPLPWGPVSRLLERIPGVNSLGHLVRVVARKPSTEPFRMERNREGAA
jgi:ubiquinone/menaquinone biosynthesis C-methylase UbiE